MRRRAYDAALVLLVIGNMALAVYIAHLWGAHYTDPAPTASAQPSAPRPTPPPQPPPPVRKRPIAGKPVPATRALSVTITAARGNCWISAHRGSATGPVLAEETLPVGQSVSLRAPKVFLELGAAGNVDVTVNGRPRPIGSGTTQIVLG
jgi:uncharacterized protein DUF4115